MTNPLLIYLAGPYSADTPAERMLNTERAMATELAVLESGNYPVIPHLTGFFDLWVRSQQPHRPIGYETYMAREMGKPVWLSVHEVPVSAKKGDS